MTAMASPKQYRVPKGSRELAEPIRSGAPPTVHKCGGRLVGYQSGAPNLLRCDHCRQRYRKIEVIL